MSLIELVLVINFPIFLGWFFKQTKIFSEEDISVLRKFVVKVTVPFIIFRNLYHADINDMSQLVPSTAAFLTVSFLFACAVLLIRKYTSSQKEISNSFCIASFMGNYGYLGWGVLFYFYGESGFTRAVFFTVFFWPAFLLTGFIMSVILSGKKLDRESKTAIINALKSNALIPLISVFVALFMNMQKVALSPWLSKSIDSFAAITIPAILFTVGLSFSVIIKKAHIRAVVTGAALRLFGGMIFGISAMLLTSLLFDIDIVTKKVILLESVMPSAAISPFFVDFIDSDREAVSGIVTFSTLISLLTLPLWYSIIETWSWI
ncbi:MAG TPA: AEC family transporter [bacterium]|nr:AEC family transporter [bacterium]